MLLLLLFVSQRGHLFDHSRFASEKEQSLRVSKIIPSKNQHFCFEATINLPRITAPHSLDCILHYKEAKIQQLAFTSQPTDKTSKSTDMFWRINKTFNRGFWRQFYGGLLFDQGPITASDSTFTMLILRPSSQYKHITFQSLQLFWFYMYLNFFCGDIPDAVSKICVVFSGQKNLNFSDFGAITEKGDQPTTH